MDIRDFIVEMPHMKVSVPVGLPRIEFHPVDEHGTIGMSRTQEMSSGNARSQLIGTVDIVALRKLLDEVDVS